MRLQIMHLPAPPDEYPFVLILDEVTDPDWGSAADALFESHAKLLGAIGAMTFKKTVEVV